MLTSHCHEPAAERILFSRHDPDGDTVDGTARVDRGPDGHPVVISDLRDLDGNPLPLPDGCITEGAT